MVSTSSHVVWTQPHLCGLHQSDHRGLGSCQIGAYDIDWRLGDALAQDGTSFYNEYGGFQYSYSFHGDNTPLRLSVHAYGYATVAGHANSAKHIDSSHSLNLNTVTPLFSDPLIHHTGQVPVALSYEENRGQRRNSREPGGGLACCNLTEVSHVSVCFCSSSHRRAH